MNKPHDCNWCLMSSCGTTLKEKSVEVETPTGVEVETSMATGVEVVTNMPTGVEEPSTGVETNTCVLNSCKSENVCCGEKSLSEKTITVKLNATVVPAKFTRYRHPSHRHRLFMIISLGHNYCNNKKCRIQIRANKTMFRCFRCDYDLCGNCFQLGTTGEPVPLAEDDNDVDETTVEPVTSWCVEPEY